MKLGVMVLCHARPYILRDIVDQAWTLADEVRVEFMLDRINGAVSDAVFTSGCDRVLDAPVPALDHKENFMEVRRAQWHSMRTWEPDYAVLWDDDHLLEGPREARRVLEGRPDLVYATKAHLWDSVKQENIRFPTHRSPFFFRCLPDDDYPLDRMIHAPAGIHDHATKVVDLKGRLLDIGYIERGERARVWAAYKRAGKIDAATLPLIKKPIYRSVAPSLTRNLLGERTRELLT